MKALEKFARLAAAKAIDPDAFPVLAKMSATPNQIAQAMIAQSNGRSFSAEMSALADVPDLDTSR